MAKMSGRAPSRTRPPRGSAQLSFGGTLKPYFQPIVDLRNGRVSGFEALARLVEGDRIVLPFEFLPEIAKTERLRFFEMMLDRSLTALNDVFGTSTACTVSINVERFLFLEEAFLRIVEAALRKHSFPGGRLILEVLEDERIDDEPAMIESLERLRGVGVRVALDDIGTGHASLMNIKNLPVDILKLDQTFARGLGERPHDLQFVLSILSLARGLEKTLVIEGVETPDILDALMILGVEFVQGYAIARPMPAEDLVEWSRTYQAPKASHAPHCLLGTFASYLTVLETCRFLMCQPLPIAWKEESKNPHNCEIGRYFDRCGLHETSFGLAHKRFHEVMTCYETDFPLWKEGADAFGSALTSAIRTARD